MFIRYLLAMSTPALVLITALLVIPARICPEGSGSQFGVVCAPAIAFDLGEGIPGLGVGDDFHYDAMGISRSSSAARSRERASHQWGLGGVTSRAVVASHVTALPTAIERYGVLRL